MPFLQTWICCLSSAGKCRKQYDLYFAFIGLTKAFYSVNKDALWCCLAHLGCPPKFVSVTRQLHKNMKRCVLYDEDQSELFSINTGVKQGCVIIAALIYIFGCLPVTSENRSSQGSRFHISYWWWPVQTHPPRGQIISYWWWPVQTHPPRGQIESQNSNHDWP